MKGESTSEKWAVALLFNSHSTYVDKSSATTSDAAKSNFESIRNAPGISVIEVSFCILKIFIWGCLRVDGNVVQRTGETRISPSVLSIRLIKEETA